jgi:hypothetical protein
VILSSTSYSPCAVEPLEGRRLLSGGGDGGFGGTTFFPFFPGPNGPPVTRQGPVNGGFEQTPDFAGWQTSGNDLVLAADFHAPPEGAAQAVISNAQIPNNGTVPVSASALEAFLGLTAGALSKPGAAAVNGSAIKQDVTGNAGDIVTFKADFLTNETTKPIGDYGFVTVTLNGKTQLFPIHAALKPITGLNTSGFVSETGYRMYTIVLPKNGTYTIGYGVVNVGDSEVASDLLVDNVQLQPRPVENEDDDDQGEDNNSQGDDHGHGDNNGQGGDDDHGDLGLHSSASVIHA